MKFTKIALAIAVLGGTAVVGGSWYTGQQVETHYQALVEQANQQLAVLSRESGVVLKLNEVKIERHFFSSDASYQLEIGSPGGEKMVIKGEDKLYHGPLPLNRLAKLNLAPVLMSMENRLIASEQLKTLFGETLGTGTANVSYSGATEGDFSLSAIKYSNDNANVEGSPIKLVYQYDKGLKTSGTVTFDKFSLKGKDDFDDLNIQLNGLEYRMDSSDQQGYSNLGLGEVSLKLQALVVQAKGKSLTLNSVMMNGKNALQGGRMLSGSTADIDEVNATGVNFGKMKFDLALDLDAKSADEVMSLVSNRQGGEDPAADDAVLQLLSKSVKLHLNNLSLENEKGKAIFSLLLNLSEFKPTEINDLGTLLSKLAQSRFDVVVDLEYFENIARQIAVEVDHLSPEEAAENAKRLSGNIANSGGVMLENGQMKLAVSIENDKLILNGRELSDSEVQRMLFLLMMGVAK